MEQVNRSVLRRGGVTWLEVLVVCAVAALVVQLLLPALPLAREAARRRQCAANLRRLGQALHQYSDAHGQLPPAAFWDGSQLDLVKFPRIDDTVPVTAANWVELLLPYLEKEARDAGFDPAVPTIAPARAAVRQRNLPWMRCPSDSYAVADNPYVYENAGGAQASFARGNYAINGGVQNIYEAPGTLMGPRPLGTRYSVDMERRRCQWWGSGVAGFNKSFRLRSITNGLATTVLLDEVRAGIHPMDPRGVWALGQIGCSVTWGHGVLGDASGPNPTNMHADDIYRGEELHQILGTDWIARQHMTFCDHCNSNGQASSRSMHPGGVHLLLCDGAARFVTDQIDPSLWHVIHCRETPATLLEGIWEDLPTSSRQEQQTVEKKDPSGRSTPKIAAEDAAQVNSIGMRFRWIPPGTFTMGLPDHDNATNVPEEVPPHPVRITSGFFMGTCEVTRGQYQAVMGSDPPRSAEGGGGTDARVDETNQLPVANVTWHEAAEFCRRLSAPAAERRLGRIYRLPTEAQWEYCCRSGSTVPHVHTSDWVEGDDSGEIAAKAWREDPPAVTPVGSFKPNAFGLYDMRGNVWEWCRDWFCRDYYSWGRTEDPQGPASGFMKVYRGTDWVFTGDGCKTGNCTLPPWGRSPYIGFRVICQHSNSTVLASGGR